MGEWTCVNVQLDLCQCAIGPVLCAIGPVYGEQATRTATPKHLVFVLARFRAARSPDLFMVGPAKL